MAQPFKQWRTMPVSALLGMVLWAVSWIWFLAHYYFRTQDTVYSLRMAAGLLLLALFVVQIKNWARMIALMINAMAILFLAAWAYISLQASDSGAFALNAANLLAFIAASYYFLTPSTSRFFKARSNASGGSSTAST
jgi:hypothetical protein